MEKKFNSAHIGMIASLVGLIILFSIFIVLG